MSVRARAPEPLAAEGRRGGPPASPGATATIGRSSRATVRYIRMDIAPRVGYEGSVMTDVLDAYPDRRIIMTFDVAETATGHDRAALIDKFGSASPRPPGPVDGRARD